MSITEVERTRWEQRLDRLRERRKGFVAGVGSCLAIALLIWTIGTVVRYQPLDRGSMARYPAGSESRVRVDDVTYVNPPFKIGEDVRYGFSVRNSGRWPVTLLGISENSSSYIWITDVRQQLNPMGGGGPESDERPVEVPPGEELYYEVTARRALCSWTRAGSGSSLSSTGVRYQALGIHREANLPLPFYYPVEVPPGGPDEGTGHWRPGCEEVSVDRDRQATDDRPEGHRHYMGARIVIQAVPSWTVGVNIDGDQRGRFVDCALTALGRSGTRYSREVGELSKERGHFHPARGFRDEAGESWDPPGDPATEAMIECSNGGVRARYSIAVQEHDGQVPSAEPG